MTGDISTSLEDWFMATAEHDRFLATDERPLRVVGLDLSLTATGIATDRRTVVLQTPAAKVEGMPRLARIRDGVIATALAPRADLVLIEGYSFNSRVGGERIGELGGVVRLALYEQGVTFLEIAPATLKIFAAGRGNAKKPEMISAARERLGYDGFDDNAADALWLWALGMAGLGSPVVELPKTHLRALEKVRWPAGVR